MNWTYNGDINLRHGGFFWRQENPKDDFVEAVDVFQYPDDEDNFIFRVVSDTIYMPREKYKTALETCGYVWLPKSHQIVDCTGHTPTDTLPLLVDAFYAYHGLDNTSQVFKIQIGGPKNPDHYDYRLNPNSSLREFIHLEFL